MSWNRNDEVFVAGMVYATLIGLVIFFVLFFGGCADRETRQFNANEIESLLREDEALVYAERAAEMVGGYVIRVDGMTNSMGQAVSPNAWIVCKKDFERTAVNDVVDSWDWGELGEPKVFILHQAIAKSADAIKTRGMNNAVPDGFTVFRGNYEGTMVAQFYYRKED